MMTFGENRISLSSFGIVGSRDSARKVRDAITVALQSHAFVTVDFEHRGITPSFADECFGGLAESFGMQVLRDRVKPLNLPETSKALIGHVARHRASATVPEAIPA